MENLLGSLVLAQQQTTQAVNNNTELLSKKILSLPIYPELTTRELEYIVKVFNSFFNKIEKK